MLRVCALALLVAVAVLVGRGVAADPVLAVFALLVCLGVAVWAARSSVFESVAWSVQRAREARERHAARATFHGSLAR